MTNLNKNPILLMIFQESKPPGVGKVAGQAPGFIYSEIWEMSLISCFGYLGSSQFHQEERNDRTLQKTVGTGEQPLRLLKGLFGLCDESVIWRNG